MGAVVAIQYRSGQVERRPLSDGVYLIGRDSGDIVLRDPDVSASHARLEVRHGNVWVTDLGSTNGTFDGRSARVQPGQTLAIGEFIRLGQSSVTVVPDAPAGGTRAVPQVVDGRDRSSLPLTPPAATSTGRPRELKVRGKRVVCHSGLVTKSRVSAYSATHVSGGDVYSSVGPGGVVTTSRSPVKSHTTHHTLHELWVRTDAGRDVSFRMQDVRIDVLEGHDVSVLARPSGAAVRVANRSIGYWYSVDVHRMGAFKRWAWYTGAFVAAWFMSLPVFSALFAIGALIEAFHPRHSWSLSFFNKIIALGFLGALFLTYADVMAGNDTLGAIDRWLDGARSVGLFTAAEAYLPESMYLGWQLSYFLAAIYYLSRTWKQHRMGVALDKAAGALL